MNKIDQKVDYMHLKGIDENYFKKIIVDYLREFSEGKRADFEKNMPDIVNVRYVQTGQSISTKDKHKDVNTILDIIGTETHQEGDTGMIFVKSHKGEKIITIRGFKEPSS